MQLADEGVRICIQGIMRELDRSPVQVHQFPANHITDDSLTRVLLNLDSSNSAAPMYDVRNQGRDDTAKSEVSQPLDWPLCWGKQTIRLSAVICGTMQLLLCDVET